MRQILIPSIFILFGCAVGLRNFRIIQESVYVNITAPDLISDAQIYIRKFNRTFDVLNSTATFNTWLNDSIYVSVKSFELKGNRYHPSVLDLKADFCKYLENPATNILFGLFYVALTKHGNFPQKCPVEPATYYVRNCNVNAEAFPPFFPPNRYMFVISISHKKRVLFITTVRYRIEAKKFFED